LIAELAGGFGILALSLATVGLYGLLAYTVTRRTGEIGIRTALGAQRHDVIAMVVTDAARLVGIGLAVGLPAAWAIAHLASSMLFGFSPNDPFTFAVAIGALVGATVLASYVPVWRATKVDPMVALRYE
jgi:ABC-type antimicrobial peptide transport system permease subunit